MTSSHAPRLTLKLEGGNVPSSAFLNAAKSFFGLLDEVAAEATGKKRPVQWSVTARHGSLFLGAEPLSYDPSVAVEVIMSNVDRGLQILSKVADRPPYFNDQALKLARDLARIPDGKNITGATVRYEKRRATNLHETAAHIDEILGVGACDFGTLEGLLETISVHNSPHLSLYDDLTQEPIRCVVEEDTLDFAWRLLRQRQRVAVSGWITYSKNGKPTSIRVEKIRPIGAGKLPTAKEIYGILSRHA